MSVRVVARGVLALWLALALPGAANAVDLFRWVTPDGRVEIGSTPPPGVHAEPWHPEQPAPPAVTPPTPAPSSAATAVPTLRKLAQPALAETKPNCGLGRAQALDLARQRQETEQEIARLEAAIAEYEDTPVAYEDSSCLRDKYGAIAKNCTGRSFDRDEAIEESQTQLEAAHRKLGDLEDQERVATANDDCAAVPAAPSR
jgi:hypothetical protein